MGSFVWNATSLVLGIDCQDYRSEWSPQSSLASYLLIDPEDDRGIDFEFINEAVRRFDEDDSVKPAFISAVEQLSAQLSSMNVNDDYKPYAIVSQSSRFP